MGKPTSQVRKIDKVHAKIKQRSHTRDEQLSGGGGGGGRGGGAHYNLLSAYCTSVYGTFILHFDQPELGPEGTAW
jgi:hypothetical protein